jgi:hypothetical protein
MAFNIQNKEENEQFPFGILVQKNLVEDFSSIGSFGYNTDVSTSFETVWSGGGLYSYPTSATTATVTSSNTGSDNNGTVLITGLDSNYNQVSAIATIGGSATTQSFLRVFSAQMKTATTGTENAGNITVTVNSKTVAFINAGYGSSLSAIYTIPANKRGFLINASLGCSKQKEVEAKILTKAITNGNVWNTIAFQTTFGVPLYEDFIIPFMIEEKTDIELRAKADATTAVSGSISLFLEDYH